MLESAAKHGSATCPPVALQAEQAQSLLWLRSTTCRASPCTSSTAGLARLFNTASGFLPGCWLHRHALKPSLFSKGQAPIISWTLNQPHYKSPGHCRVLCSQLTMSSLPFFCSMLEKAIVVRTQAASEQYVLMAARCWASPWSEIAELKLGQYIHRYRVPGGMGRRGQRREREKGEYRD